MADAIPLRRRRLQYSLGSLLIALTVCAIALAWFVRPEYRPVEYKALGRAAIEGLGSAVSTKVLGSANVTALTAGLNELGADGWELVAVEPEHQTAVGGGTIHHEAMYVFKRNR